MRNVLPPVAFGFSVGDSAFSPMHGGRLSRHGCRLPSDTQREARAWQCAGSDVKACSPPAWRWADVKLRYRVPNPRFAQGEIHD